MDKVELKRTCKIRGIGTVKLTKEYIKKYNKQDYTEDDIIEIYRIDIDRYWRVNTIQKHNYQMEADNKEY